MRNNLNTRTSSKGNAAMLFNRYVWLVDTIYRAGRITFEEINERWRRSSLNETGEELPLKTFHNHKNAIQQMFDINIECNRKGGYIYYIEHAEDKRRILFEEIPSGQRFLTQIIEAMRDGRTIEMTYKSFWNDTPHTFEVAPYCVKVFRQRWYVVARSLSDEQLRVYALDRIQELRTTENAFALPEDFDPQAYFADSVGVVVDEKCAVERVKIRVQGIQRQYIRTLPLHTSQQEVETNEDSSVFEFHLRPTLDFQQELLTHAVNAEGDIEVLVPQWLREHMKSIGEDLWHNHQNV